MLKLVKYMKKYTIWIILIFAMLLLQVYFDLMLPSYTANIVDIGIQAADIGVIISCGFKMLFMAALSVGCTIAVSYMSSRVSCAFSRDLRTQIYEKVLYFSNQEMNRFSTSSLITRSTNDITQVQNIWGMIFRTILYAPILGIGGIIKAAKIGSSMWWTILLAVVLAAVVMFVIISRVMPAFDKLQKMMDRVNMVTREILTGVPVIRAFSRQEQEQKRFDEASRELAGTSLYVNRGMLILTPAMTLIMNGLTILILFSGGREAVSGGLLTGDIMAFIQYAVQIVNAFVMISSLAMSLPRASVSANRIFEVMDTEPSMKQESAVNRQMLENEPENDILEFKNVSFRYPGSGEDTLKNISVSLKKGETAAIVGSTGSGKTTLLTLALRLQDATAGEIRFHGCDIRTMDPTELRDRIGYVPQKTVLFSGTIRSNLQKGKRDADVEEMNEALSTAQAAEFINENNGGLERVVSQNGANFSGGQKQRISIARAIIREPELYLFDDCFSALDAQTDRKLRQALAEKKSNSAVLIVSQRISTILHADKIIVLEEGEIAGVGTHGELLKNCSVYKEIAESQLQKEEKTA